VDRGVIGCADVFAAVVSNEGVSVGAGGLLLLSGLRLVFYTDAVTSSMVDHLFAWLLAQTMVFPDPLD